ncbi:hypothetical protein HN018_28200 (plasmid) [Lichenicola cladoniae]|uniref:Uncharacterized protein n=1 Tax=Lichenicola cladoniae TaxID=1484109 RepID=A0A6M8I1C3_9PROT|nr:hypothetical protein [Lichenicola cladoniae]NPD70352.1 hypothetical protein [Acetobacteraceae bacterium]QKE94007.1 hypothetical protein HN018_28200 [Lichenicola cladoniae]
MASVGGRAAYGVAVVLSAAVRVPVVVVLRLLRPFIMFPLLLAMIGGLGAAIVFAWGHHWLDAGRAGLVVFVCALLLAVYSRAAVWIDPEHFDDRNGPSWRRL